MSRRVAPICKQPPRVKAGFRSFRKEKIPPLTYLNFDIGALIGVESKHDGIAYELQCEFGPATFQLNSGVREWLKNKHIKRSQYDPNVEYVYIDVQTPLLMKFLIALDAKINEIGKGNTKACSYYSLLRCSSKGVILRVRLNRETSYFRLLTDVNYDSPEAVGPQRVTYRSSTLDECRDCKEMMMTVELRYVWDAEEYDFFGGTLTAKNVLFKPSSQENHHTHFDTQLIPVVLEEDTTEKEDIIENDDDIDWEDIGTIPLAQ